MKVQTNPQFKETIQKWSNFYVAAVKESADVDLQQIPMLVEQNWSNHFLFLAVHYHFLTNIDSGKIHSNEYAHSAKLIEIYTIVVNNTFDLLERLGVNHIEALTELPGFFARHYDYLNLLVAGRADWPESACNSELKRTWFATRPADMLKSSSVEVCIDDAKHIWERGIQKVNSGDNEGALLDFKRASLLDPENHFILNSLGQALSQAGKHEEADQLLSKAISKAPNDHIIVRNRGVVRFQLNNYKEAITDLSCAIQLQPDNVRQYVYRAESYYKLDDYELALSDLDTAIELDPNNAYSFYLRGAVRDCMDQWSLAIEEYSRCIELEPDFLDAYERRSMDWLTEEDRKAAIQDLDYLINKKPDCGSYYYKRAVARIDEYASPPISLNDLDLALADAVMGWALYAKVSNPHDFKPDVMSAKDYHDLDSITSPAFCVLTILEMRAKMHLDNKNFQGALEDCEALLAVYETSSAGLQLRAQSYLGLNNVNAACSDWRALVEKLTEDSDRSKSDDKRLEESRALLAAHSGD